MLKKFGCVFIVILLTAVVRAEIKITPIANLSLLGGQYFLKSENTSFGGNTDIFFSPVVNFSPETALLPIAMFSYRGTKDVQELVGGGTLTQEYMDTSILLKLVHKFSDSFKAKTRLGYKLEHLKETKDEEWSKGLFDYNRVVFGLEAEKMFSMWNMRAGYDFYTMKYPNYNSLISQDEYETSLDTTTYKEISTNAGKNVLDYQTHEIFVEGIRKFSETTIGKVSYDLAMKSFADQHIVKDDGSFSADLRGDLIHLLSLTGQFSFERMSISIADSIQYYTSTQNSFDAGRAKYISEHYNFTQNNVSPSILFYLGRKEPYSRLNIFWDFAYRQYQERLAQDTTGDYLAGRICQTTNTIGMIVSYPINKIKGFSAKVSANYRSSSSNMKYEKNYKYNYYVSNYFAGIEWAY